MARGRFCVGCGYQFPNVLGNFCCQCGTPRDDCEVSLVRENKVEQHEEVAINNILDSRGPLHVQSKHQNCTLKSPSYNTIFNPPPIKNRKTNKVYGKLSLRKNWAIQHNNLKENYKEVKKWIKEGKDNGVLPQGTFSLEDVGVREALNKIIEDNITSLQELKFKDRGESYKWSKDNIYRNIKKHLKYRRQKQRRLQRRTTNEAPMASQDAELYGGQCQSQVQPLCLVEGSMGEDNVQASQVEVGVEPLEGGDGFDGSQRRDDVEEDEEAFVLKKMGLTDVDDMYSGLESFMIEKNLSIKPKPFPSSRRVRKLNFESRLQLVATFFRGIGHQSNTLNQS